MAAYGSFIDPIPTRRLPQARALVNAKRPPDGGSDRRWIAGEAGAESYLGALLRMILQPTKFAVAWSQGAKTISPLKFVAVSTTIVLVTSQLVMQGSTSTTWSEIAASVTPALVFALLGVLIHLAYKLFGSQRSVETSLGLTLFTIAGPGLFFPMLLIGVAALAKMHTKLQTPEAWQYSLQHLPVWGKLVVVVAMFAVYLWPRVVLGRVLHAVHRRRWWWTVLALLFAELVLALLFGTQLKLAPNAPLFFNWPRLVITPTFDTFSFYW